MCATAMSFARLRRLYFGASDPKMGGVENGPRIFSSSSCQHRPEVQSFGVLDFFKARRIFEAAVPAKERLKQELASKIAKF